ncbi:hypothetical protein H5410_064625 [Solanum commersonii]|uniref:Uncharacterized protein n=1 Tax=Solanum commersonii TaxID=4109 RepID=A0A9J5VYY8_SOLCO|nr:hypothetical protein H5410_064625 [Solanum commersonii]
MGIPFLLAFSISSRRANSLLHFLKCVLSRPVPPCVPVVTCFMINLHFVQVKRGLHLVPRISVVGLVGVGVSSSSSFISTSSKLEVANFYN